MLIGIHELDCARTCFGESSGGFSTPSGIDLGGLIGVVDALKQNVSDDRATISVERENVSNQPCSVRCHKPSLPGRPLPHRASFAAQDRVWTQSVSQPRLRPDHLPDGVPSPMAPM